MKLVNQNNEITNLIQEKKFNIICKYLPSLAIEEI